MDGWVGVGVDRGWIGFTCTKVEANGTGGPV